MIDTRITRDSQFDQGSFRLGNGPDVMLVMGSCRAVPYLNYFKYCEAGSRYTIHFIDPFYYYYHKDGSRADICQKIDSLEGDSRTTDIIKSAKVFVHEYYKNYGMFNTEKEDGKNIYQFGMNPDIDVTLPNFNNIFVLFQDFAWLDEGVKQLMKGGMTSDVVEKVKEIGLSNIAKFLDVCRKTDMPQMADIFEANWRTKRFFWSMNHVSNNFTMEIFRLLSDNFLSLNLNDEFWARAKSEDMYANPHTPMTAHDVNAYGLKWKEPMKSLIL